MKEVADIVFCEREKTNKKINVKIVCNTEMQELNKTFRNKDKNKTKKKENKAPLTKKTKKVSKK